MIEPKWTPGPWRVEEDWTYEILGADGLIVTKLPYPGQPGGSNAHLIGASPELYAALIAVSEMLFARPDMVAALHRLMGPAEHAVSKMAAAALAKARGEKP